VGPATVVDGPGDFGKPSEDQALPVTARAHDEQCGHGTFEAFLHPMRHLAGVVDLHTEGLREILAVQAPGEVQLENHLVPLFEAADRGLHEDSDEPDHPAAPNGRSSGGPVFASTGFRCG
jgi:hypothetical protein